MHVHVYGDNGQARFWLEPSIELAENNGLRSGEITTARHLIEEHCDESNAGGKITLEAEVTQIDKQGIWLLIGEKESFLPFDKFPWFRDASVGTIHHVELLNNNHLYWPDLDIDLAVESIEHPERFPQVPG